MAENLTFYLGAPEAGWLTTAGVPLFLSRSRLQRRSSLPTARASWALDSGAFSELSRHGRWTTSAHAYAQQAQDYQQRIGQLDFASPMDWMCEPPIRDLTRLSVSQHQLRTTDNFLELRSLAPDVPWIPVLQGWDPIDYLKHLFHYRTAGVSTTHFGLGSICRRQGSDQALTIIRALTFAEPLQLHAFGLKTIGLRRAAHLLASSDSMAWSSHARRRPPLPACSHASCSNCLTYALRWRERLIAPILAQHAPLHYAPTTPPQ